jgi:hypothetical protein
MKVKYISVNDEGYSQVIQAIQNREECFIVNFVDDTYIGCGQNSELNEDICKDNNILILRHYYLGGGVINFPGDLGLMEIRKGYSNIGRELLNVVDKYLQSHNLTTLIHGNDLMVLDKEDKVLYKVVSFGSNWIGEYTQTVFHASINTDIELIKKICLKPMKKIPGSLSKYGITGEELWRVILNYLNNLNYIEEC